MLVYHSTMVDFLFHRIELKNLIYSVHVFPTKLLQYYVLNTQNCAIFTEYSTIGFITKLTASLDANKNQTCLFWSTYLTVYTTTA